MSPMPWCFLARIALFGENFPFWEEGHGGAAEPKKKELFSSYSIVMLAKMVLNQSSYPISHGEDSSLGLF